MGAGLPLLSEAFDEDPRLLSKPSRGNRGEDLLLAVIPDHRFVYFYPH